MDNNAIVTAVQITHLYEDETRYSILLSLNEPDQIVIRDGDNYATIYADTWPLMKEQLDSHFDSEAEYCAATMSKQPGQKLKTPPTSLFQKADRQLHFSEFWGMRSITPVLCFQYQNQSEVAAMQKLKPPKNYRRTTPRCCMTCKHFTSDSTEQKGHGIPSVFLVCERDSTTGETCEEDYFRICDFYSNGNVGRGIQIMTDRMKVVVIGSAVVAATIEELGHEVTMGNEMSVRDIEDRMPDPTMHREPTRPIQDWQQPGKQKVRRQK